MNWIMSERPEIQKKARYHHGDLRTQLLEATRQLVETSGPDHFSVAEACRVAGVSTAAPYRHFKDKEEMLMAVTLQGVLRHRDQMLAELTPYPPGDVERIVALGRVYVRFAQEEPGVFRLMFGRTNDHEKVRNLMKDEDAPFDIVEREVANYLGRDEVDQDVRQRAFLLWASVHGLSFLLIDKKVSVSDLVIDVEAFLWDLAHRAMA